MDLFNDQETNGEEPEKRKAAGWTGVVIAAATLPLLFYFRHIGKTDMGLNIGICLGMNLIVIRLRWNLRRHLWFWVSW